MTLDLNKSVIRKIYFSQSSCISALVVACMANLLSALASAQESSASSTAPEAVDEFASADAGGGAEGIVVTGTRVSRDGYQAPTPLNVLGAKDIKAEAPANISDFVNTLPSVRGSTTASQSSGALSNGEAGIAAMQRLLATMPGSPAETSSATHDGSHSHHGHSAHLPDSLACPPLPCSESAK